MLHLALVLALAVEPVPLPAPPDAVERSAPAPRWPAALFFTAGGVSMWTGVALLAASSMCNELGPCPRSDTLMPGAIAASLGLMALLTGTFWLIWTRRPEDEVVSAPVVKRGPLRWPSALFLIGGALTGLTGGAFVYRGLSPAACGHFPCPDRDQIAGGAVVASLGFASVLAGIYWLVTTRAHAEGEP